MNGIFATLLGGILGLGVIVIYLVIIGFTVAVLWQLYIFLRNKNREN